MFGFYRGLALVAVGLGMLAAQAGAQLSRLDYTPHLEQVGFGPHGEFLPNDGLEYCVPTSLTMACYWFLANGMEHVAPSLTTQHALDTDLAIAGFYGTTPEGGTTNTSTASSSSMNAKIRIYLGLKGISGVDVTQISNPTYQTLGRAVSGSNIGVINIAWEKLGTDVRVGGHDVTLVATGIDEQGQPAVGNVVINNPLAPQTQYVPTEDYNGHLAFMPGYISAADVVPVISAVTILHPSSFGQPFTAYRPATNLRLAASGGTMSVWAPIVGEKGLIKTGASTVVFEQTSRGTYRGTTRIYAGRLESRLPNGPVLGHGNLQLLGGTIAIAPDGSGSAAPSLGMAGKSFSFTSGTLEIDQGRRQSVAVRMAANLLRGPAGNLLVAPSHGLGTLGGSESLLLGGNAPAGLLADHGIVAPVILGVQANGTGDFLRYDDAKGFVSAGIGGGVQAGVGGIASDLTLDDGQVLQAFALRIDGASVHGGGTLRLSGNASSFGVAGLILNGGEVETGRLDLDAGETVVFASRQGGLISAKVEGAGSLIVTGPGKLRLTGENIYAGSTTINGTTLLVGNATGSATGGGSVLVRADATLGGIGRIGGDVRVEGVLQPGENAGLLEIGGNVRFANQSQLNWELATLRDGPANGGANWGLLDVRGDLAFNGNPSQFQTLQLHFPRGKSPNTTLAFWQQPHRWLIARARGKLVTTGLAIEDPRFDAGRFSIESTAHQLLLVYTPASVPVAR